MTFHVTDQLPSPVCTMPVCPSQIFEIGLTQPSARSNPWYLNHLASQKLLDEPSFVAYLDYLQYFASPEYIRFLT
jgi:hypothetical protein